MRSKPKTDRINAVIPGAVVELLESQYEFLELSVVNAIYDRTHAVLNIFYDPDTL